MRYERHGDMDLFAVQEAETYNDRLRQLVDELDGLERHVVERLFFGGAHLKTVASEAGVSKETAKRALQSAFDKLRPLVLEDDTVGPLPAAAFDVVW